MKTNNKPDWKFLKDLPFKSGRYVVIDTETTGLGCEFHHLIEIAAVEVINESITGSQFHTYLKPRVKISPNAIATHHLPDTFYDECFPNVYQSDKSSMENFLKFVGDSIIFAHNAPFDYYFVNSELKYWNLPEFDKTRWRCTMRIFKDVYSKHDPDAKKYGALNKCSEYLKIKPLGENFHNALFDSFIAARILLIIYRFVDQTNNQTRIVCQVDPNKNETIEVIKQLEPIKVMKVMIEEKNENVELKSDEDNKHDKEDLKESAYKSMMKDFVKSFQNKIELKDNSNNC